MLEGPNELHDYRAAPARSWTSLRGERVAWSDRARRRRAQLAAPLEWFAGELEEGGDTPRLVEQDVMLASVAGLSADFYVAACALQHEGTPAPDDAP